jgi:hypothetical protein
VLAPYAFIKPFFLVEHLADSKLGIYNNKGSTHYSFYENKLSILNTLLGSGGAPS